MKCEKCGKEIPDGENKICEDCKKKIISELDSNVENSKKTEKKSKLENDTKNETKKSKLIIISVLVLVILVLLGLLFKDSDKGSLILDKFSPNEVGNTIPNIRNYGYCASQGNFIYYIAPVGDKGNIGIYRAKKDGSNPTVLLEKDWGISGLNVRGEYLYFIAMTSEELENSANLTSTESVDELDNKICRMKTDGTGLEEINSNELHNNCYDIYVIGEKLYYIGTDSNIWYMDLDGKNKTKLNDEGTGYLGISKDYIIFNSQKDPQKNVTADGEALYETCVMNIDGTNKHSLNGKRLYSIDIVDDYIYYVDENKIIHKIKVDGTDDKVVLENTEAYNMNISDKYIFFMNYKDAEQGIIAIYRVDLDGKNKEEIYELTNYSAFLNVINGQVVFMDSDSNAGTINMIDENGKNRIELYRYEYSKAEIEDYQTDVVTDNTVQTTETTESPEVSTPTEEVNTQN